MRILLVISISNILKINSGGSQRNALFAKALAKVGQVDIICFTEDDITLDIPNCKVLFSKEMYRHSTLKDSLRTLIGTAFQPSSPYSYFTVDKEKETIIDHFVKKGNYDVIATRYIDKAIEGAAMALRRQQRHKRLLSGATGVAGQCKVSENVALAKALIYNCLRPSVAHIAQFPKFSAAATASARMHAVSSLKKSLSNGGVSSTFVPISNR